jgi:hypothetical protein
MHDHILELRSQTCLAHNVNHFDKMPVFPLRRTRGMPVPNTPHLMERRRLRREFLDAKRYEDHDHDPAEDGEQPIRSGSFSAMLNAVFMRTTSPRGLDSLQRPDTQQKAGAYDHQDQSRYQRECVIALAKENEQHQRDTRDG